MSGTFDGHHRALETHVVLSSTSLDAFEDLKVQLRSLLAERFGIGHATFEASRAPDCDNALVPEHCVPSMPDEMESAGANCRGLL